VLGQDVDEDFAAQLRLIVRLVEVPGDDRRAEANRPDVHHGLIAGHEAEEVALAGSVGTQYRNTIAEPELGRERVGQTGQLEAFDHDSLLTGASAAQLHLHLMLANLLRRLRRAFHELAQL
jgi:hypothetical protein